MTTDHLDDVLAGLTFLKSLPSIDSHRIAMVGHSFGGQLTLLAAERDSSVRAAITFGAAAASWKNSSEVRECLLAAARKTNSPIMLVHAANDYSTIPGKIMAEELEKLGRPHLLKFIRQWARPRMMDTILSIRLSVDGKMTFSNSSINNSGERSHQADAGQENAVRFRAHGLWRVQGRC